jgi:hypothetical protein
MDLTDLEVRVNLLLEVRCSGGGYRCVRTVLPGKRHVNWFNYFDFSFSA